MFYGMMVEYVLPIQILSDSLLHHISSVKRDNPAILHRNYTNALTVFLFGGSLHRVTFVQLSCRLYEPGEV